MTLCKRLIVDVKTGEQRTVEENMTLPPPTQPMKELNLDDLAKLVANAKAKGEL